jgi:hypothetical protein
MRDAGFGLNGWGLNHDVGPATAHACTRRVINAALSLVQPAAADRRSPVAP